VLRAKGQSVLPIEALASHGPVRARRLAECAVREEVIPRNAATLVKVAAPQYAVNRGLTAPQAQAVLKAARIQRLGALYVLALFLGLRRGELLGLRWEDVDLDVGKLEVVQTFQRVGGALQLVPPKTEGSRRTVPLPGACVEALCEHKRRQFRERSDAWPDWEDHGLVFPSRRGTPMEPDNLRRSWSVIRTAAGLPGVRFHDLRHTCVTLLLDLGVPPHVVREIVGHSAIEVTMTIYAHASLDESGRRWASSGRPSVDYVAVTVAVKRPARRIGRSVMPGQSGGQGQDRTADLPLFRRLCESRRVHQGPVDRPTRRVGFCWSPGSSTHFQGRC
jgi:integrase